MYSRSTILGACLIAGALSIPSLLSAQETKEVTKQEPSQAAATQETAKPDAAKPDAPWHVAKTSGEVWVTGTGVQAVSLTDQTELKSGESIRTGKTGRVLLTRGNETLLLSPNSAIALPELVKDGMTTTIEQAAGSILLDVEHRDVQHFEVVTPFLAAVVKGTQFRVTVNERGGQVEVTRGQVQVADFKSGQFALMLPGQTAGVGAKGNSGLTLSGSGTFNPVQQGQPRASDIKLIRPEHGSLPPPKESGKDSGSTKALRLINAKGDGPHSGAAPHHAVLVDSARANANHAGASHASGLRIAAPLGEVHVNFQKVTNGLAHDTSGQTAKNGQQSNTIWGSSGSSGSSLASNGNGNSSGGVSAGTAVAGAGSPSGSSGVGAQIGAANKGNNGNGNNGNGNGNGNGGVGNGNGKGNAKH
jgi:hypothetical protein